MFVLPIVFMAVFATAFGSTPLKLDFKAGIFQDSTVSEKGLNLADAISKIKSANLKIAVTLYESIAELNTAVSSKKVDLGIKVLSGEDSTAPFNISIIGNLNSSTFLTNKSVIQDIVYPIINPQNSQIKVELIGKQDLAASVFDILVPGLIIYGLLILIPGIAQSFTSITEKEYIFRFANSKAKSHHIILGTILYYLLISTIQIAILYATALAFGYKAQGSILIAYVPAIFVAFFVIGIGLLIGAFVKKTDAATNIGTIVSIILGFFSGSFIVGIGKVLEVNLFGRSFQLNDFLPSKWGTTAIDKVLSQNMQLKDIGTELIIILVSGLVIILIGIFVYKKKQLDARK